MVKYDVILYVHIKITILIVMVNTDAYNMTVLQYYNVADDDDDNDDDIIEDVQ